MNYREYPVLVVGGGPAGLATSFELAQQGLAATVIERSAYDDLRIGEHLHPANVLKLRAISARANLPLDDHFASAGVVAYWGSESANYMDYFMHAGQHGINLSRPRFDAELAHACELSGVTVWRSASLVRAERKGSIWNAEIIVNGSAKHLLASMIVDATGRSAAFARRQGAKVCADDRQVAVIAFGRSPEGETLNTRSLVEAAELGWWYKASINPECSICMFVTDYDLLPRGKSSKLCLWWLEQLDRTVQLRSQPFQLSEPLLVRSARSQHLDIASGPGWLAVGDAALAFDPLSSQGIANALDQGKRGASSIVAYISGDQSSLGLFSSELQPQYAAYRIKRMHYYRLEMRWKHSLFWRRRHEGQNALPKVPSRAR